MPASPMGGGFGRKEMGGEENWLDCDLGVSISPTGTREPLPPNTGGFFSQALGSAQ